MNIGFINFYPWRPHGFHAAFLAKMCNKAGHNIFVLECAGSSNSCYSKLIQGGNISRCIKCKAGSLSTYGIGKTFKINTKPANFKISDSAVTEGLISSSATLYREELESLYMTSDRLIKARETLKYNYERSYYSTLEMISKNNLDSIIVFNGRIDMTRAAIEAAKDSGINFITHERPYMGHGIQLNVNENCLGLKSRIELNKKFDNLYLTKSQAAFAGAEIAKRFLGTNHLEWRVYNKGSPKLKSWPTGTNDKKILIVPSSRSEVGGHDDWATPWSSNVDGLSLFLKKINAKKDQVVVRFHPNWSQNVGLSDGESSRRVYKDWCESEGFFYVDSNESVSTIGLIADSDVVILNGGSAGVEAAALGKKIINLGSSPYKGSSFCYFLESAKEIEDFPGFDNWMSKTSILKSVLRYFYTAGARFPQYCQFVRASETTNYEAYSGADPARLESIINDGILVADDEKFSFHEDEEDKVIDMIKLGKWNELVSNASDHVEDVKALLSIKRRIPFNFVDKIRPLNKRGDL